MILRVLFDEKLKAREILLQEGRAIKVHESSFHKHQDRGKSHVMMSHLEADTAKVIPEGKPDLDRMAQQVENLFKTRSFYNQMDLTAEQHLVIAKAIIELTDPSGGSALADKRL